MKTFKQQFLFTTLLTLFSFSINSQSLNNPESVTYEKKTNSYFVSNVKSGDIQVIDKNGLISTFISGYSSFLGIKIYKGIIYCAEDNENGNDFIRGFCRKTGKLVFSLPIPKTIQLNDIEVDKRGNLYASDRGANKIYKINLKNKKYTVIDSTIKTPNGLYYNRKKNSLLICNTVEKSSIYEIDLRTKKTKLLINTGYPNLDGITVDNNGLIYLTSWSLNWEKSLLLKYDGKQFYELLTNNSGMADIEYNKKNKAIEIAKYIDNSIMSYKLN